MCPRTWPPVACGRTIEPDLIVFATGFYHDTRHLGDLIERDAGDWPIARRCESRRTPGMYVLGLPFTRRRRSNLLAGVGPDAEALCGHLVEHLGRARSAA